MRKKPFIQVYLTEELKEKLKREAKSKGIPVSVLVRLRLQGELPIKTGAENEKAGWIHSKRVDYAHHFGRSEK